MLCPKRKDQSGRAEVPNEYELNMIRNDPVRLKEIRSRLSDISWWMRLLSQKIGKRANDDDIFSTVAGKPKVIEQPRSRTRHQRYKIRNRAVELLTS